MRWTWSELPGSVFYFNPAENAISTWKLNFKTQLKARQHEFINITDERRAGQSLADYQFRSFGKNRESSKGSITVAKCRSCQGDIQPVGEKCSQVPSCVVAKGQYTGLTFGIIKYTVLKTQVSMEFQFFFTWMSTVSLEFPFIQCFTWVFLSVSLEVHVCFHL